jgi:transposase InsO family protein
LREAGILASMGRTGDAYDNALCESFSGSLECELLDRSHFVSREAARIAIFEWLETWYAQLRARRIARGQRRSRREQPRGMRNAPAVSH